LRPSSPEGYIRRGDARNFNLDHQSALEDYSTAVKLAPSSLVAHLGRGLAYTGLEKYDLAIKEYQWVLKSEPNNHEALGNIGIACMLAGRRLEAVTYFEKALTVEKDPQWRTRMDKWMARLISEADSTTAKYRGPTRTPPDAAKPLW
jgi:tetratricopeptide (TPR) repeat protein